MTTIDAFHLPGLAEADIAGWDVREYADGEVRLRVPVLEPHALTAILDRIRHARLRHLAHRSVAKVVAAVDRVAQRLADPTDEVRRLAERALPAVTGYSAPMIQLVLDRMADDWREDALWRLLHAELGDPALLDGFRPMTRGMHEDTLVRALGPELAFHVFAGNVPGVAVTSLIRSLLVKSATLGKSASGDPLLPALFARTLAAVAPDLGECIAVTYWPGGNVGLEAVALEAADMLVVYGGGEVVESLRARAGAHVRIVEHGPRLSFAVIAREMLAAGSTLESTAAAAARAIATFDQQGCVSPHVIYVERGGETSPKEFAAALARALDRAEQVLPRGRLSAAENATIQQVRGAAEFRALGGQDVVLHASHGTEYTVIYDADPTFTASCLNRVAWVKPVDDLAEAVEHVRPYARYLQTVGVAAPMARRTEAAAWFAITGASRITDLERMPWPPPTWHHDGREPLRELIRWVDLER